jgi:hypothetical protein
VSKTLGRDLTGGGQLRLSRVTDHQVHPMAFEIIKHQTQNGQRINRSISHFAVKSLDVS